MSSPAIEPPGQKLRMTGNIGKSGFIGRLYDVWQQLYSTGDKDRDLDKAIEEMIDIADPAIRQAKRYRKILHEPVAGAMGYCATLIESVPGPITLSKKSYDDDPTVRSLFVSSDDLEQVLRISPEVEVMRKGGYVGDVVALLTMTKEEKTVFGHQMQGEMVMRDVAQRAVNFVDHRLVAPSADLPAARGGIVARGLEILATVAMERITNLKSKAAELREKREYLRGVVKILGGRTRMHERFTVPDPALIEERVKAEQALSALEAELEMVTKALSGPVDSLRYLDEVMQKPAGLLTVQRQSLMLDWMNVRVDSSRSSEGHEIPLAEFCLLEEFRRYGIFVRFSLDSGGGTKSSIR